MAVPLWLAGFPETAGGTIILLGLPTAWLGKRRGKALATSSIRNPATDRINDGSAGLRYGGRSDLGVCGEHARYLSRS